MDIDSFDIAYSINQKKLIEDITMRNAIISRNISIDKVYGENGFKEIVEIISNASEYELKFIISKIHNKFEKIKAEGTYITEEYEYMLQTLDATLNRMDALKKSSSISIDIVDFLHKTVMQDIEYIEWNITEIDCKYGLLVRRVCSKIIDEYKKSVDLFNEPTKYVLDKDIAKQTITNEVTSSVMSIAKVISDNHPNGYKVGVPNSSIVVDPNMYIEELMGPYKDLGYIINKLNNLVTYIDLVKNDLTPDKCKLFDNAVRNIMEKSYYNITATRKLRDIMIEIKDKLSTVTPNSQETSSILDDMIYICDSTIDQMDDVLGNLVNNECISDEDKYDLFTEMGIGYIHIMLADENSDIGEILTESAESFDNNILTEALFGESELDKKKKEDKYELKKQKQQDKYEMQKQKRQDKYEQQKQKKQAKEEQKQTYKNAKNQIKTDTKIAKEEEKANNKKVDITINKWKTMEITNVNAYKAVRAIKRAIGGVIAGGVTAAALTPALGVIVGAAYVVIKYVRSKKTPYVERQKIMKDIEMQIIAIDEKIAEADRNNATEKKIQLMQMKSKLETLYKRSGYSLDKEI